MPRPASASPPTLAPPSALALLLLPLSVLADGALFWPAACLVAITAAVARRPGAMLVWYGLAVGFDIDALVLAPFVLAQSLRLRISWRSVPLAPAFALAMLLARYHAIPSVLVLPQDLALTTGAPTLWAFVARIPGIGTLPLTGLALASAIGAIAAYTAWATGCGTRRIDLLDAALLCALLPVLSPAIGTHAFLLADALALLVAGLDPRARRWWVAALAWTSTALAWRIGTDAAPIAALAMLGATLLQTRAVLKLAANDNPRIAVRPLPPQPETLAPARR